MTDNARDPRQGKGFLHIDDLLQDIGSRNTVLDGHSVLISQNVQIGNGNTFYPNVVLEATGAGSITIGDNNVFYPGVYMFCSDGSIVIGSGNEFGSGGCTIKANMTGATVTIGDNGRYMNGVTIMGKTTLGSGSQVLGFITVQNCMLGEGGDFSEPDPDKRAAVLKGFGIARGITLEAGQVINGAGNFSDANVEWQRSYHPKP